MAATAGIFCRAARTRCCDCGHPAVPTPGRCAIHHQKLLREKDRELRRKIVSERLEWLENKALPRSELVCGGRGDHAHRL